MNFRFHFNQIALLILWIGANNIFGQSISSFSPWFGQHGDLVTINGSGFVSGVIVKFNGVTATSDVTSTTQIQAYVPNTATTGPITVGSSDPTTNFVVIGAGPFITDFSPGSGGSSTAVTINGVHFTGTTSVKFGGVAAGFSPPTTDTQLLATAPSGVLSGPISVTSSSGTGVSSNNFYAPPSLTSFSPTNGHPGTNIVITGKNFLGATAVRFNGTDATSFTVNTNSQITATLPTNATTGVITIIAPAGQISSSSNFVVLPTIFNFSPTTGTTGTVVTINGIGFNAGTPVVKFNGSNAVLTSFSSTQILTTVPTNATSGPISVTTTNGTDTGAIFYLPLAITSFSPGSGAAGITVTVNGQNFTNASAVKFNGINAATFNVVNNGQLTAAVPATMTGPITIIAPGGTMTTSSNFFLPPSISSFTPVIGVLSSPITISGASFIGATAVKFNGVDATTFSVNDNSTITANVPLGASSGTISVVAPGGTAVSASSFMVEPLKLFIDRLTNNFIAVSWTTNATGFGLQFATNLISTNNLWSVETSAVQVVNGKNTVTNLISAPEKFYRLKK